MEPESANQETPLDSDDGGPMDIAVMEGQTDRPHERPHGCDTSTDETSSKMPRHHLSFPSSFP